MEPHFEASVDERGRAGWWLVLAPLVLIKSAIHLLAIGRYGYFRDELYYLASTEHLGLGYVDHPPLSIWVLALQKTLLGDSLPALRTAPLLAGLAMIVLVVLTTRELGGGRFAQLLAGTCVLTSGVYLGTSRYYSMNALDQLAWAATGWLLVRIVRRGRPVDWVLLGALLGLGLLNKISILWLGAGIGVGLVLTRERRWLATPWPWVAATMAGLVFTPYVVWQVLNDWPTLEFIANATREKMVAVGPLQLLANQILEMNPATAPVWLGGLCVALLARRERGWRLLGLVWLTVFAILALSGTSKGGYLAPANLLVLGPGAVWLERAVARVGWRGLHAASIAVVLAGGAVTLPFAIPVLPVDTFARYMEWTGIRPSSGERYDSGALPQHYADMFGWEEMAREVADAYQDLPPEERERCAVFGQNYGEAGAIDVLGRRLGLPPALSGHNSYWYWGPRGWDGRVVIILGGDEEDNASLFDSLERVGVVRCERCMAYERDLPVYVGRGLRMPVSELWLRLRSLI